jgi:hypothetical protein
VVPSQPGQTVHETLSQKIPSQRKKAGRVAQGEGPEFKTQYCKRRNKNVKFLLYSVEDRVFLSIIPEEKQLRHYLEKHKSYKYTFIT